MPAESTPSTLRTRSSLLFRLRKWDDEKSWEECYRMYRKLVYGFARRSGLPHEEADEVTNDVFVSVSRTIQDFESSPERGSFRGWLMNLTRWRVLDKVRSRPQGQRAPSGPEVPDRTSTIERVPDPRTEGEMWDKEWQERILEAAMERVARRAQARHFQVFELLLRRQWSVLRVSRELGLNPASIYLINHRLTKQLKAEVASLTNSLD